MAKKKAKKKGPKPFDPLAQGFKYQKGFRKAVRTRARGQIQPELNTISSERRSAASRNEGRNQQIGSFFGAEQEALKAASDRVNSALNNLITSSGSMMGSGAEAFAAALRGGTAAEQAAAQQMGLATNPADTGRSAGFATAADIGQRAIGAGLGSQLGATAADAAARPGVSATGQRQASELQSSLFARENQELDERKQGLFARMPQLLEEARAAILQEEQQKQAQRFQQRLAGDEFDLKEKSTNLQNRLARRQQNEAEKQGRHGRKMDRKQFRLSQDQLALAREELMANIMATGGDNADKQAAAAAERFDKAADWITGYLAPNDRDKVLDPDSEKEVFDQGTWRSNRRYNDAFHILQNRFGLSEIDAHRVMSTANIREWRIRAKKRIQRIKGVVDTPGNAPGIGNTGDRPK